MRDMPPRINHYQLWGVVDVSDFSGGSSFFLLPQDEPLLRFIIPQTTLRLTPILKYPCTFLPIASSCLL